jgi:hypothetical protein
VEVAFHRFEVQSDMPRMVGLQGGQVPKVLNGFKVVSAVDLGFVIDSLAYGFGALADEQFAPTYLN